MAIAAPLAVIPLRTKAEDGEIYHLIEERGYQFELECAAESRWREAVQSLMPADFQWSTALQSPETVEEYLEICRRPEIDALFAESDRRRKVCLGLGNRLAETPATTLSGINAKMKVAMKAGRNTAIARSAADDLERLAGRAEA